MRSCKRLAVAAVSAGMFLWILSATVLTEQPVVSERKVIVQPPLVNPAAVGAEVTSAARQLPERTTVNVAVAVLLASNHKSRSVDRNTINGLGVLRESILSVYGPHGSGFKFAGDENVASSALSTEKMPYGNSSSHPRTLTFVPGALQDGRVTELNVVPHQSTIIFDSSTDSQKRISMEFVLLVTDDLELPTALVDYIFHQLKWQIRVASSPLRAEEIRNKRIADEVVRDGAMGINEMIKIEALRFRKFDKVLMLDADILFHRRFDELFDMDQVLGWTHGGWTIERLNGGFLVFSPKSSSGLLKAVCGDRLSPACPLRRGYPVVTEGDVHFANIVELLREGDFRVNTGWKGCGIGWTYGGRTIQGLLPYYFFVGAHAALAEALSSEGGSEFDATKSATIRRRCEEVRLTVDIEDPSTLRTVPVDDNFYFELSRCRYNNMAQLRKCKQTPIENVTSNHFTGNCMKPWQCIGSAEPLCVQFQQRWFQTYAKHARKIWKQHGATKPGDNSVPVDDKGGIVGELLGSFVGSVVGTAQQYSGCRGGRMPSLVEDWLSTHRST